MSNRHRPQSHPVKLVLRSRDGSPTRKVVRGRYVRVRRTGQPDGESVGSRALRFVQDNPLVLTAVTAVGGVLFTMFIRSVIDRSHSTSTRQAKSSRTREICAEWRDRRKEAIANGADEHELNIIDEEYRQLLTFNAEES